VVIGLLVALTVVDSVVGSAIYNQRQRQLLADYFVRRPWVNEGRAIGIIQIESLKLNEVIVEGVRPSDLRSGPAHWPGTAEPGAVGTCVILGTHRRFGGSFADIGDLVESDPIVVQRKGGSPVQYSVTDVVTVDDSQAAALMAMTATEARLVLVSSPSWKPWGDKIVVTAVARIATASVDQPSRNQPPLVPSSFEPFDAPLLNENLVAAFAWLFVSWSAARWMSNKFRRSTTAVVLTPMALMALVSMWFAISRLLPSTL
jgi:LPXTG-site transpeptidase (sortase) family protein